MPMTKTPRFLPGLLALVLLSSLWAVAGRSDNGYPRMMQGPMIGAVGPTEARIWCRVSGLFPVKVKYATNPHLEAAVWSEPITPALEDDLTVTIHLAELAPATTYYYKVYVNDQEDKYLGHLPPFVFHTAPDSGKKVKFKVATGSCARTQRDWQQPIWETVLDLEPDAFIWLGDNIYGDSLQPIILAEEYRRQREVAAYQPVMRGIPNLAIWDDHDYGLNDHDRTNPIKAGALEVFKQYWANPSYGTEETPGVFFKWSYGGVDFFFLDIRYYRDPNHVEDTPKKTMLGAAQRVWLQEQLEQSTAPFKLLISGSGWTSAKGSGGDSWAAFLHARDSLFEFIRKKEISGVVLVSGDTHTGELNCIPWSKKGGYDLYDLVSSPLAQLGSTQWRDQHPEARIRPGFSLRNTGLITFDMTADPPTLTYNIYDTRGEPAWKPFIINADQLQNGVSTYKEKQLLPDELLEEKPDE